MPGVLLHEKTVAGSCTIASRVGPQDWNSTHQQFITLVGNTLGASTISGTNIRLSGGANISLSVDGQTIGIVGGAGAGGVALSASDSIWTSGTVVLTGSRNITIGTQPGSIVITGPDLAGYLTTAALSNHSHGNPSLALTNLSGTTNSGSNGLTLSLSALHSNAITEIRVSGTPPAGSAYTGAVTDGLVVFTNPSVGVTSAAQPNVIPMINGSTISFRVYPEFYHHRWWAWGVYTGTATALMPFWEVNQGNTMQDVWFDISGGSAYQELVWPGVSDANSHTIAIWDHMPVLGMSNLGNTAGTSGIVQSGNARLLLAGGANITLSQSINGQSATVSIVGGAGGPGGGVAISASDSIWTSGTVVVSGSRNITVGTGAGSIIITGPDLSPYLTTAAASNHSHGNPSLALTNLSGTTGSNSAGLTISLSADPPGAGGGIALLGGTITITSGTAVLTGTQNITITGNGQTISVSGPDLSPYLTTAAASNHSHGNPSLALTNLSGTTGSNSGGLTMSLSAAAPADAYLTITQGQQISLSSSVNGASVTLTISATNVAGTGTTFAGANLSGSMTLNSNGLNLSMSAAAPGAGGGIALQGGTVTITSGTAVLTGVNNITITGNGQTVSVSGPDLTQFLTTAALSNHSHGNPSLALTNLSGTTGSASNGLTLSLSAADPGGGAAFTKSIKFLNEDFIGFNTGSTVSSVGTNYFFQPIHMDAALSCSNLWLIKSINFLTSSGTNASGNQRASFNQSLYFFKRSNYAANSRSLTYYTSASWGLTASRSFTSNSNTVSLAWVTNSTGGTSSWSTSSVGTGLLSSVTGHRLYAVPLVTSFSQGEWFMAHRWSSTTATTGSAGNVMSMSNLQWNIVASLAGVWLPLQTASTVSNPFHGIGMGSCSAITTNADMDASAITAGGTLQLLHGVLVNMGVS